MYTRAQIVTVVQFVCENWYLSLRKTEVYGHLGYDKMGGGGAGKTVQ
jgi:hypothetical protein